MSPPTRILIVSTSIVCLALAGAAQAATVLTATDGNVSTAGKQLEQLDEISSVDTVQVEDKGIASLVVANSAIVKMCHGATLGFDDDQGDGPSTLTLRNGQLKVSSEKRPTDNPLEIHTPAAIATLLGTELHVDVDPETGNSTFTSIDHQIRINSVDTPDGDGTVISAGERVVVRKGEQPGAVKTADIAALRTTSDCLDKNLFRVAAVSVARQDYGKQSLPQIAAMDVETNLPAVSAGLPIISTASLGPPTIFPTCQSVIQCAGASTGMALEFIPNADVIVGPPGPPAP